MQSKVAPFAATPDPTFGRRDGRAAAQDTATANDAKASDEADLRLVIEEDQAAGTYVYKTVNRRSGEVVQQIPQEEVLRLREDSAYLAGGVIRTKA
jgi:flagellar protein FlaG